MALDDFENGIEIHNRQIQAAIAASGMYVNHESGYSYTVGLNRVGAPEVFVCDQSRDSADEILLTIYQAVVRGMLVLKPGVDVNSLITGPAFLEAVTPKVKRSIFYAARTYFGSWSFSALFLNTGWRDAYDG